MSKSDSKILNRIKDRMLLGTLYDQIMLRTRYRDGKTAFLYGVMAGQKHRMIFYSRYKKKYLDKCTKDRKWESLPKTVNKDTVWVMWLQGIESAPDIVRKCIESQKRAMPDKEFIIINEDNVYEYAELPEYIVEKRNKGIISNAQFSDLVRLSLLNKYGGYWIDATVFFTDNSIVSWVEKTKLFMYSFYYFGFNPEIMEYNSWFIYSTTNNNVLCLLQKMMHEYWKENNRLSNYYLWHIMESIANDYYKDEIAKMPILSQAQAHVLATYIYDDFDKDKYHFLKTTTGIHKLSIKFDTEKLMRKGTFYDVIFNEGSY